MVRLPHFVVAMLLFSGTVMATLGMFQVMPLDLIIDNSVPSASLLNANGRPAIVFLGFNATLQYIRANDALGSSWPVRSFEIQGPEPNGVRPAYRFLSATIVNGNPAVAFHTSFLLQYVRAADSNGTTWNPARTIISCCRDVIAASLVVADGFPAVGYGDKSGPLLGYLRARDANGDSWNPPQAVFDNVQHSWVNAWSPSTAIINGRPAAAVGFTQGLRYIRALSATGEDIAAGPYGNVYQWGTVIPVDLTGNPVNPILLEVGGKPAIVYALAGSGPNLRIFYAYANDADGTSWKSPQLIAGGDAVFGRFGCSVGRGLPTIAYFDQATSTIYLATAHTVEGLAWDISPVITGVSFALITSLAEIDGVIALAYVGADNKLVYAYELKSENCRTCTTLEPLCMYPGVAQGTWCTDNCISDTYGGACTPAFCTCPSAPTPSTAGLCRACTADDPSCSGVASDSWCTSACTNNQYNAACSPSFCVCPLAPAPPTNPCTPCTKATDANCYLVASAKWCQANCVDGKYGGACDSKFCFCP